MLDTRGTGAKVWLASAKITSGGEGGDEGQEEQMASLVTTEMRKLMFEVPESDLVALLAVLTVLCVGGGQRAQLKLFEFGIVERLNKIASLFSASDRYHRPLSTFSSRSYGSNAAQRCCPFY
ncbi:hypothetical protein FOL47_004641 [Perkinsus chesapeaki]|uniref:Uncharacterized protein n=1 Tax=Perkinsus chesapeaki TaxID=330153 RepID=A0A7J6M1K7_PERCH|nr:hypothetical protein FOL47_004641 [Perkinsus chesapeaki]